jgi:predicted secreted acid phosphatase
MFKRVLCPLLALAFLAAAAPALEPSNLQPHKAEIRAYVDSGSYVRDVARVSLDANKYLVRRLNRAPKPGKKLAIVFDVDETTLSNLSHMVAHDFGYVEKDWNAWIAAGRAPAIIPVQSIYDTAVRGKIDIFFITGRPEEARASTERNLRDVGYDTWTKIFFQPPPRDDVTMTARGFKIDTRRQLEQQGYIIVANVGDQVSDLVGGYAERFFKLPNPFYITQ